MSREVRTRSAALPAPILCAALALATAAAAQNPAPAEPTPGCNLSGSPDVLIQGGAMLRLGDVTGCKGVRYEIIHGVMVNGQPAVQLLPSEECSTGSAESVTVGGAAAQRQGDAACPDG